MQHKHHHKTVHQRVEAALRHRLLLVFVVSAMFLAVASADSRVRELMRHAYAQGWGFIGAYLHHEHPSHQYHAVAVARIPTVSGS